MEVLTDKKQEFQNLDKETGYSGEVDITEVNGDSPKHSVKEEFREININDSQQHSEEEEATTHQDAENITNQSYPNPVNCPEGLNVTISNNNKLGSFKEWSKGRFTYTKQLLSESFGYGTKTVDSEIEKQINFLNDSKVLCTSLIAKARAVQSHMSAMNNANKHLSQLLCENSLKDLSPYKEEMMCNGQMLRHLHKHTDSYDSVLRMFIANLTTLNDKTLDDSLNSVRQYEACRLEYDAYRVEYEEAQRSSHQGRISESRNKYETQLGKFNQNRSDLLVKIKLFEENKDKVIKRNLNVLQSTLCKYACECGTSLTETASHYDFKSITGSSWLEDAE